MVENEKRIWNLIYNIVSFQKIPRWVGRFLIKNISKYYLNDTKLDMLLAVCVPKKMHEKIIYIVLI